MGIVSWIVVGLLIAALAWFVLVFNRLVRARNLVLAGLSDIDVQLQRRHDLVPPLVEAVRGYAAFEQSLLREVTELRGQAVQAGDIGQRDQAEEALAGGLGRLIVLAEAYPELKAGENFRQLMDDLVDIEDHLQHARRFYNGAVRELNTRVQQFPDLLVARLTGFGEAEFFGAGIEARAAPDVAAVLDGGR